MRTPLNFPNRILMPLQIQLTVRSNPRLITRPIRPELNIPTIPNLDTLIHTPTRDNPRPILIPIYAQHLARMSRHDEGRSC